MDVDDDDLYGTCIEGAEEHIEHLLCVFNERINFHQQNIVDLWIEMQNYINSENYQTITYTEVEKSIICSGNHQFDQNYDFNVMMQSYEELMNEKTDDNLMQHENSFNRILDWLINEVHTEEGEYESLDILGSQRFCNVDNFHDVEKFYQKNTSSSLEYEKILSSPRASTFSRNGSPDLFKSITNEKKTYNLNNLSKDDIEIHENFLKLTSNDSYSIDSFNWKKTKKNCNSPDLFDQSDEQSLNNSSRNLFEEWNLYSDVENISNSLSELQINEAESILQNSCEISQIEYNISSDVESVLSDSLSNNFDICTQPCPCHNDSLILDEANNDEIKLIELNLKNRISNETESNINDANMIELYAIQSNIYIPIMIEPNTNKPILIETIQTDLCEDILSETMNPGDIQIVAEEPVKNLSLRQHELMDQIKNLINSLQINLNETGTAHLLVVNTKWSNISLENAMLALNRNGSQRKVSYSTTNNRFKIIMYLLCEIYTLLSTGFTCNIRELYYKNPDLCRKQENVVNALKDICCYLNTSPWELKILSTSKGLIAGPIRFITNDNEIIDCNNNLQYGTLIPYDVTNNFEILDSDAKFILIVEKDTIFQKLLQHKVLTKLGELFILITGKGYPDMSTRLIINKISAKSSLPLYILVDGDPFGIEIMLTYKYGSRARVFNSQELTCPEVNWIGLYPSEIDKLFLPSISFNSEDKKKLNALFQRPYLNEVILSELEYFSQTNRKAEIEALTEFSVDFLIDDYLVKKVNAHI